MRPERHNPHSIATLRIAIARFSPASSGPYPAGTGNSAILRAMAPKSRCVRWLSASSSRKNKTFFFADYEGLRRVTRQLSFVTVPTLAQRQGILGTPARNPYTGEIYSDGVLPKSVITAMGRRACTL